MFWRGFEVLETLNIFEETVFKVCEFLKIVGHFKAGMFCFVMLILTRDLEEKHPPPIIRLSKVLCTWGKS